MSTEYFFIPSAFVALYGIYNIYKIKQRLRSIEIMLPTMKVSDFETIV